ncbi:MAG: AIR synthase-related protein, partial [Deltaproteobacteria bacterium]|nr:AIR synthase-related protein [Deltaproteobacteria bacterium]
LGRMKAVTAMIDVSDGLLADLGHILEESGCGARIFLDQIPVVGPPMLALSGGEDYELLFTARPAARNKLRRFYKIGRITKKNGLKVLDQGKEIRFERKGYDHFRG